MSDWPLLRQLLEALRLGQVTRWREQRLKLRNFIISGWIHSLEPTFDFDESERGAVVQRRYG
jgi:hypothetical protein